MYKSFIFSIQRYFYQFSCQIVCRSNCIKCSSWKNLKVASLTRNLVLKWLCKNPLLSANSALQRKIPGWMVRCDGKLDLRAQFFPQIIKGNAEFLPGRCWYSLQMEIKDVNFSQQNGYCNVPSYSSSPPWDTIAWMSLQSKMLSRNAWSEPGTTVLWIPASDKLVTAFPLIPSIQPLLFAADNIFFFDFK